MKNIYINITTLVIAFFLYFQIASASDLPSFNVDEEKEQASTENTLCGEDFYSNSKFDYKSHYVTSLRFTLPKNSCLPKNSNSLDKQGFISSD